MVLKYIQNEAKIFKKFVANWVLIIRGSSRVDQWHYVNKKDNPVDLTSRGTKVGQQRETGHVV